MVGKGKLRLIHSGQLVPDQELATDRRITDWEDARHLTRSLIAERGVGVAEAARLVLGMEAERAEKARALAYRLYSLGSGRRRRAPVPCLRSDRNGCVETHFVDGFGQ